MVVITDVVNDNEEVLHKSEKWCEEKVEALFSSKAETDIQNSNTKHDSRL